MKLPRATRAVGGAVLVAGSLSLVEPVQAAEYGSRLTGLGYGIPLSGYTPPPGVYFSDTFYLYSGTASANVNFPFGKLTAIGLTASLITNIAAVRLVHRCQDFWRHARLRRGHSLRLRHEFRGLSFVGPLGFNRQLNRRETRSGHRRYGL